MGTSTASQLRPTHHQPHIPLQLGGSDPIMLPTTPSVPCFFDKMHAKDVRTVFIYQSMHVNHKEIKRTYYFKHVQVGFVDLEA